MIKITKCLIGANKLLPKELQLSVPIEPDSEDPKLLLAQCQTLINVYNDDTLTTFNVKTSPEAKNAILKNLQRCKKVLNLTKLKS